MSHTKLLLYLSLIHCEVTLCQTIYSQSGLSISDMLSSLFSCCGTFNLVQYSIFMLRSLFSCCGTFNLVQYFLIFRAGWHRVGLYKVLSQMDFHVIAVDYRGKKNP